MYDFVRHAEAMGPPRSTFTIRLPRIVEGPKEAAVSDQVSARHPAH
jgi:hypothetical protein